MVLVALGIVLFVLTDQRGKQTVFLPGYSGQCGYRVSYGIDAGNLVAFKGFSEGIKGMAAAL